MLPFVEVICVVDTDASVDDDDDVDAVDDDDDVNAIDDDDGSKSESKLS